MLEKVCKKLKSFTRSWKRLKDIWTADLDEDVIEEPLTPNHLYCGHGILNPIEGEGYESDPGFNNNREQALLRKHQLEQVLCRNSCIFST